MVTSGTNPYLHFHIRNHFYIRSSHDLKVIGKANVPIKKLLSTSGSGNSEHFIECVIEDSSSRRHIGDLKFSYWLEHRVIV